MEGRVWAERKLCEDSPLPPCAHAAAAAAAGRAYPWRDGSASLPPTSTQACMQWRESAEGEKAGHHADSSA
jgi:hypothetical protein